MNIVAEPGYERCKPVLQTACSCISRGAMLALRIFARYWWTMKAWYARLAALLVPRARTASERNKGRKEAARERSRDERVILLK